MAWQIEVTDVARKQLKKMDHAEARLIRDYLRKRVQPLDDPRQLGKPLKGQLSELWRYRVGDYRLVCQLQDDKLVVLLVRVGHRKEIYR